MVGRSLRLFTLTTKVTFELAVLSLTVTVIVVVPLCPVAGVIVTVRFAPLPPKTMFASGTNVVLLDEPVTVSAPTLLSISPIVKPIAPVGVFSFVD